MYVCVSVCTYRIPCLFDCNWVCMYVCFCIYVCVATTSLGRGGLIFTTDALFMCETNNTDQDSESLLCVKKMDSYLNSWFGENFRLPVSCLITSTVEFSDSSWMMQRQNKTAAVTWSILKIAIMIHLWNQWRWWENEWLNYPSNYHHSVCVFVCPIFNTLYEN